MSENIDSVLNVSTAVSPAEEFQKNALISSEEQYQAMYKKSIEQPEEFWGEIAENSHWFKKWDTVRDWSNRPFAKWFVGGKTNIAYNCLDRQIAEGKGDKVAIYWEGEPVGDRKSYTYSELTAEVCKMANVLKSQGVQKGDRVAIYLPMIPELVFTMLACARLGAVHSIIFAGFSATAVADRVNDCKAKVVVTSDGAFRRGKVLDLKSIVDAGLESTTCVTSMVVVKRTGNEVAWKEGRDHWLHDLNDVSSECEAEQMDSEDPLFILYTSGSTGKPKGVLHSTGGYMVGTQLTTKYVFDLKDEDIYWCTADIGWITGHSYIGYGPLSNGATQVMFEGAPNYPAENRFWEIIEHYKVSIFYTAPTAIRAFEKWGEEHIDKHDISSLRLLGSVGEPISPETWNWYYSKIGSGKCPIVDTWWQTETGAIMITPLPGIQALKPGSATRPFFGIDVGIVDEKGNNVPNNKGGLLVIKQPWPSMVRTIYGDDARFKETYWERFEKQGWYLAGDGAMRDDDGCHWILGRIDDVINVSGHRLSTMEVESALISHELVKEVAVVGYKHEIKGQGIAAFVTLPANTEMNDEVRKALKMHVRADIGAIAQPDKIYLAEGLPKTRSGKIMRRLLRQIADGEEITGDVTTLEDPTVLDKLKQQNG
jgi:acetyl-CoA synthetase